MDKRLEQLNSLLRQGLITPETYAESFDIITKLSKGEQGAPVPKPRQERPVPKPRTKSLVPAARKKKSVFTNEEMDRYVEDLLSESVTAKTADDEKVKSTKVKLAWQRTPFAIGNFLRGWVINVPANHAHANDAEILLDGLKATIKSKVADELKSLRGSNFNWFLKLNLQSKRPMVKTLSLSLVSTTKQPLSPIKTKFKMR